MRIFYPGHPDIPAGLQANGKPWPELRLDQLEAIYRVKRAVTEGVAVPGLKEPYRSALVGAGMGSGKAQPLDSLVLTPQGFTRMGDVKVGTEVVLPDGGTAPVSGIFPQGQRPVYRVTLIDGREVLADGGHLWTVLDRKRERVVVKTTDQMLRDGITYNRGYKHAIQAIDAPDLGGWASSLDPWVLGAIIGNGGISNGTVRFSTADEETVERLRSLLPGGVTLVPLTAGRGGYDWCIRAVSRGRGNNPVMEELRRLGLMGKRSPEKSIPDDLLHSSRSSRIGLVQGLLDTDGSGTTGGGFEFSSASEALAGQFVWLVRSLGGKASIRSKVVNGVTYWAILGRLPDGIPPFRCQRKLDKAGVATKYPLGFFSIKSIEPVGLMETQCIMVDHPEHEYVTDGFTRTHNTVVSVEVILHTAPERCLIVGVRDAYGQWAEALRNQQHAGNLTGFGAAFGRKRKLHRIDNTPAGRENLAHLVNGDPGIFYVGLEMLRAQDWEKVSETLPTDPALKAILGDDIEDTITITEKRQLRTYAKMPPVDLLISDEAHKHSSQKSAAIKTMETIPTRGKIALSGTFFGNKFENAWALTVWLWGKEVVGSKGAWETRWAVKEPIMSKDGKKQVTTPHGFPLSKITGERNPGEFVETLPCYVFIATPIGDPPEPEIVKIDLHPEQLRQYEEMESQSLTWIPSTRKREEPLIADLPLTQRIRLRTAALGGMTLVPGKDEDDPDSITFEPGTPSSTLKAVHEVLHRPSWVGKKALILTHSRPFAIEAARRIGLKYTVALKTGETRPKDWEDQKRRFMLPVSHPESVMYCVAVISAVGTATDGLQANCAKVLWMSEDDSNVNNIQASNRVWRQGVDVDSYEAVKLIQRGTIAEGILAKNRAHRDRTMSSVQGAR